MEKLCECGCGEEVKNRFVHGHNNRGKNLSKHTKQKMSKAQKGRIISQEHRAKISETLKGNIPWNNGIPMSEEAKQKSSESHKGKTAWNFGTSKLNYPYCETWRDREYVDDLRGPSCECCGITNMMNIHLFGRKLSTHHKNGKKECAPKDIMTLCNRCHAVLHKELKRMNKCSKK
jgi:hypothetical protein